MLVGYDMKIPYRDMATLNTLSAPLEGTLNGYDVGRNVSISYISLFTVGPYLGGETFPMLENLGDSFGSVSVDMSAGSTRNKYTIFS